jgi:CMP-N-acetylneuraminic acid synthetase
VSTDDQEIAEVAKEFGAEVPFIRPVELAQDDTPDQPVFKHALQWLNTQDNYQPEVVLHLRCTTPFKTETDIAQVLEKMAITNADSVRTMSRIEGKYHPYWTYKTGENGWAVPFLDGVDMAKYFQRQLLPKAYFLNGLVDAIKPDIILNHQNFWGDNIGLVETSAKRAIDIDTPDDFEYAEFLMRKNAGNTN